MEAQICECNVNVLNIFKGLITCEAEQAGDSETCCFEKAFPVQNANAHPRVRGPAPAESLETTWVLTLTIESGLTIGVVMRKAEALDVFADPLESQIFKL